MNLMVRMVLFLVILNVKSSVSQGQILHVALPSVLRNESYGAFVSLAFGSQSQILWFSTSNLP